jgi:hypothetical protein
LDQMTARSLHGGEWRVLRNCIAACSAALVCVLAGCGGASGTCGGGCCGTVEGDIQSSFTCTTDSIGGGFELHTPQSGEQQPPLSVTAGFTPASGSVSVGDYGPADVRIATISVERDSPPVLHLGGKSEDGIVTGTFTFHITSLDGGVAQGTVDAQFGNPQVTLHANF